MQHDFFLSYRRTDQPLAAALVAALEARGAQVWWDQHIEGGEDWREAIVTNLEASQTLVILFSEACNSSRQLRKELAIADLMDKPVIPVLIEDTTPKGHFLYELAALNWLQIHPDPASRMGQLSERLVSELRNGARPGAGPRALEQSPHETGAAEMADVAAEDAPPPVAAEQAPRYARKRARGKLRPAPTLAEAKPKARRNFLAFKWYEVLIALLIAALPIYGLLQRPPEGRVMSVELMVLDYLLLTLVLLVVMAALVFPFRYYFRRLRARTALVFYLASVWFLSALMGVVSALHPDFINEGDGVGGNVLLYVVVWGAITLVVSIPAFAIYAALHFQRSLRQVKSNTEMIGAGG